MLELSAVVILSTWSLKSLRTRVKADTYSLVGRPVAQDLGRSHDSCLHSPEDER